MNHSYHIKLIREGSADLMDQMARAIDQVIFVKKNGIKI